MTDGWIRRDVIRAGLAATAVGLGGRALAAEPPQRTLIIMCDGFGLDYYDRSAMPVLKDWAAKGIFVRGEAVMPTVTNCNNASICCGVWPSQHGLIGNTYLDPATGEPQYMEDASLLMAPTIFERAKRRGVASALISAKKKTVTLLPRGADIVLTSEAPGEDWVKALGAAPPIYSREVNYWVFGAALHLLRTRPDIGLIYLHTTDYPMHSWAPDAPESLEHLARIDGLLREVSVAAPDAAVLMTADHGMNHKTRGLDLDKALAERGTPIRIAISAERDRYVRHHLGLGGTAWVYLNAPADAAKVRAQLAVMEGIEAVYSREEAAQRFHLMPERIGDLVVLGDKDTVFGTLDHAQESLPPGLRTHGSLHERFVPILLHNARGAPDASFFTHNLDLARWMFPA